MKRFLKIAALIVGGIGILIVAGLVYFILTFPKAEKVPDIKVEAATARLARGEYLVNHVVGCVDCHSERDWTKYAGPVVPGTRGKGGEIFDETTAGVPGVLYAKDITPSGIGNWTDGELIRAITTGVSKDGTALFPLMPYQSFNSLTEEDLYSIVAYIRSFKPIQNSIPERHLDFPMGLIVKSIPLSSYTPSTPVDTSDQIAYGKYLVTIAVCSGCHTPLDKGQPRKGMDYAGGMEFGLPAGIVRSANITPDNQTGIGRWSKEQFVAFFKSFSPDSTHNIPVGPKEYNTVMPMTQLAGMTRGDLGAIYVYLRTIPPVNNQVVRFTPTHQSGM